MYMWSEWPTTCTCNLYFYRAQTFHAALDCIGEVHSILPGGLNIMALTATATRTLQYPITRTIGMRDPYILARSPCEKNMVYSVSKFEAVPTTFKPVVERLKSEREKMPRMIIYGKSFGVCADICFLPSRTG